MNQLHLSSEQSDLKQHLLFCVGMGTVWLVGKLGNWLWDRIFPVKVLGQLWDKSASCTNTMNWGRERGWSHGKFALHWHKLLSLSQCETIGINQRARFQELDQYVGTVAKKIFSYCKDILNYLSCIYRVIIFHCINHLTLYNNAERNSSLGKLTLLTWKRDCFEMFPLAWLFAYLF